MKKSFNYNKNTKSAIDAIYSLQVNKERNNFYYSLSDEQKELFNSIQDNIFTLCNSTTGSGKTTVALNAMIQLLCNEDKCINKIIYIQTVSERFLEHGYLTGNLEEKTAELWTPIYNAFTKLGISEFEVSELIEYDILKLTTDSNLRGVNFNNAGVIIDEAENMDFNTLKLIFTRILDNCHVALLGDPLQRDNSRRDNTVFIRYGRYLAELFGKEVTLTKNFRGAFSTAAEKFMDDNK